jgi:hypothetical protein
MKQQRRSRIGFTLAALGLVACGGDDTAPAVPATPSESEVSAAHQAGQAPGKEGEEIDPESLNESGSVDIKQYTVAYIGSGTLGKGTLTYQGKTYPFRIGGLGIGGIGVSSIDAYGTVYDLPDRESFAGTYGNARIGFAAADKGKGKLWLKNTNGVVLKLETKMKGLALSGGADGIVITWESDVQKSATETKKAWSDAKQGSKKAWDSAKDVFK